MEQVAVALVAANLFLALQFKFQPFKSDDANLTATMAGVSTACTLTLATLFMIGQTGPAVTALLMFVNALTLVMALRAIFINILPAIRTRAKTKMKQASILIELAQLKLANREINAMTKLEQKVSSPNVQKEDLDPATDTSSENSLEPHIGTLRQYFSRYDLDASGTINSAEELEQLCINLFMKLNLHRHLKVEQMEEKLRDVDDIDTNPWDFQDFRDWFEDNLWSNSSST